MYDRREDRRQKVYFVEWWYVLIFCYSAEHADTRQATPDMPLRAYLRSFFPPPLSESVLLLSN
jgi:hypothetical protein